eukprot:TRINITY_DN2913_c0_g4_i1.p1 TRINITY_DN2913_c0_g4~~TRINITY_DN2913_c0_g4_i1.p1  ORF type:complete len:1446 (+),score=485.32 TRINITY_DN2913_c0_g4_i1:86-4423(+)
MYSFLIFFVYVFFSNQSALVHDRGVKRALALAVASVCESRGPIKSTPETFGFRANSDELYDLTASRAVDACLVSLRLLRDQRPDDLPVFIRDLVTSHTNVSSSNLVLVLCAHLTADFLFDGRDDGDVDREFPRLQLGIRSLILLSEMGEGLAQGNDNGPSGVSLVAYLTSHATSLRRKLSSILLAPKAPEELKVATLSFVHACLLHQPGLSSLFVYTSPVVGGDTPVHSFVEDLKKKSDKSSDSSKKTDSITSSSVLRATLDLLKFSEEYFEQQPVLLSSILGILHTLWSHGGNKSTHGQITALLRHHKDFWKHLCTPLRLFPETHFDYHAKDRVTLFGKNEEDSEYLFQPPISDFASVLSSSSGNTKLCHRLACCSAVFSVIALESFNCVSELKKGCVVHFKKAKTAPAAKASILSSTSSKDGSKDEKKDTSTAEKKKTDEKPKSDSSDDKKITETWSVGRVTAVNGDTLTIQKFGDYGYVEKKKTEVFCAELQTSDFQGELTALFDGKLGDIGLPEIWPRLLCPLPLDEQVIPDLMQAATEADVTLPLIRCTNIRSFLTAAGTIINGLDSDINSLLAMDVGYLTHLGSGYVYDPILLRHFMPREVSQWTPQQSHIMRSVLHCNHSCSLVDAQMCAMRAWRLLLLISTKIDENSPLRALRASPDLLRSIISRSTTLLSNDSRMGFGAAVWQGHLANLLAASLHQLDISCKDKPLGLDEDVLPGVLSSCAILAGAMSRVTIPGHEIADDNSKELYETLRGRRLPLFTACLILLRDSTQNDRKSAVNVATTLAEQLLPLISHSLSEVTTESRTSKSTGTSDMETSDDKGNEANEFNESVDNSQDKLLKVCLSVLDLILRHIKSPSSKPSSPSGSSRQRKSIMRPVLPPKSPLACPSPLRTVSRPSPLLAGRSSSLSIEHSKGTSQQPTSSNSTPLVQFPALLRSQGVLKLLLRVWSRNTTDGLKLIEKMSVTKDLSITSQLRSNLQNCLGRAILVIRLLTTLSQSESGLKELIAVGAVRSICHDTLLLKYNELEKITFREKTVIFGMNKSPLKGVRFARGYLRESGAGGVVFDDLQHVLWRLVIRFVSSFQSVSTSSSSNESSVALDQVMLFVSTFQRSLLESLRRPVANTQGKGDATLTLATLSEATDVAGLCCVLCNDKSYQTWRLNGGPVSAMFLENLLQLVCQLPRILVGIDANTPATECLKRKGLECVVMSKKEKHDVEEKLDKLKKFGFPNVLCRRFEEGLMRLLSVSSSCLRIICSSVFKPKKSVGSDVSSPVFAFSTRELLYGEVGPPSAGHLLTAARFAVDRLLVLSSPETGTSTSLADLRTIIQSCVLMLAHTVVTHEKRYSHTPADREAARKSAVEFFAKMRTIKDSKPSIRLVDDESWLDSVEKLITEILDSPELQGLAPIERSVAVPVQTGSTWQPHAHSAMASIMRSSPAKR